MSLLRSYSFGHYFGVTELPEDILGLFLDLVENPSKKIEFAHEIVSAGLRGKIDLEHYFNIDAYEATIRKNQRLGIENKRKRESYIDFSDSCDDWDETVLSGGIKADIASMKAVNKMEDAYEKLLSENELEYAVKSIKSLQPMLLVDAKLDIIHTMRQALKGIPESVKLLRQVCDDYKVVADNVKTILESGFEFNEIFS